MVSILIPCRIYKLYIESVQILQRCLHRLYIDPTKILHRPHIIYRSDVVSTKALHTLYIIDTAKLIQPKHKYIDICRTKEGAFGVISIGYLGISLMCL